MKSQDIVVLLKLVSLQYQELANGIDRLRSESVWGSPYSVRNLGELLGISKTEIAQSIKRSVASGIARKDNSKNEPRPSRRNLFGFITTGLKFVFPAQIGPSSEAIRPVRVEWATKKSEQFSCKNCGIFRASARIKLRLLLIGFESSNHRQDGLGEPGIDHLQSRGFKGACIARCDHEVVLCGRSGDISISLANRLSG